MIQRLILILVLSLLLTSCGGAAPAPTEAPLPSEAPVETRQPTQTSVPATNTPSLTSTASPLPTNTPAPTNTLVVTPTDTSLPTLVLPTEPVNAPVRLVWDGTPTYPGDSTPGYSFRVTYDPDLWALTTDQFGFPALGHRTIPNCVISVTSGRGLPPNISVEHEMLQTDGVTFDVSVALENGIKKFVTFTGGDGTILSAFQVDFQEESETCLQDAVTVLSTLESVPVSQATPAP